MFSRATIGISQSVNKYFLWVRLSDSLRDYTTDKVERAPALQQLSLQRDRKGQRYWETRSKMRKLGSLPGKCPEG